MNPKTEMSRRLYRRNVGKKAESEKSILGMASIFSDCLVQKGKKIMNYMEISHCNQLNGIGNRVVLWVAGCSHHCKNCQNAYSWDPSIGVEFDSAAKEELFKDLSEDWCDGITYSGGDPLFEGNRLDIIALAAEIKKKFPAKTQWLYTGYTWAQVLADQSMSPVLKYIDVLCDGEYIEELRDIDRHWVGSSNQEVIDVKKRIAQVSAIYDK